MRVYVDLYNRIIETMNGANNKVSFIRAESRITNVRKSYAFDTTCMDIYLKTLFEMKVLALLLRLARGPLTEFFCKIERNSTASKLITQCFPTFIS